MTERVTIPTMTLDRQGESYGGAYWDQVDMRFTLTDEGDKAVARVEDSGGTVFDEAELDGPLAVSFIALIENETPATGIPLMVVTPSWRFNGPEDTLHLEGGDLDEVAAWLKFWLGLEEWDPDNTEWEW